MNKNYFRYLFRKHKLTILFMFLVYVIISVLYGNSDFKAAAMAGYVLSTILCFILPVLLFHPIHKRSGADQYFALPISRHELLVTSEVFMFLIPAGYFTIASAIGAAVIGTAVIPGGFAVMLLLAYLGFAVQLLVTSALFLIANNLFDGIVMIAAYTVFPLLTAIALNIFTESLIAGNTWFGEGLWIYFLPIYMSIADSSSSISGAVHALAKNEPINLMYIICLALHGVVSLVLLRKNMILRRSERAEQISDGALCYPAVITAYAAAVMLPVSVDIVRCSYTSAVIESVLVLLACVIASFIYRRNMTLTWKPFIGFACAALITVGFSDTAWRTKGFGIPENDVIMRDRITEIHYAGTLHDVPDLVEAEFSISLSAHRKDEAAEAVRDLFEEYRKECINEFYSRRQYKDRSRTWANLIVQYAGSQSRFKDIRQRRYSSDITLTLDQLKVVNELGDADVFVYKSDYSGPVSLQEYLHQ